jgi:hypothetical protein
MRMLAATLLVKKNPIAGVSVTFASAGSTLYLPPSRQLAAQVSWGLMNGSVELPTVHFRALFDFMTFDTGRDDDLLLVDYVIDPAPYHAQLGNRAELDDLRQRMNKEVGHLTAARITDPVAKSWPFEKLARVSHASLRLIDDMLANSNTRADWQRDQRNRDWLTTARAEVIEAIQAYP